MSRVLRVSGITYGNMVGQDFTQWRVELLEDLLDVIVYCYGDTPLVAVENICIWYDADKDFHRMSFESGGNRVVVRFYKFFSVSVNDMDVRVGFQRHEAGELAAYLRGLVKTLRNLGPRLSGAT